MHRKYEEEGGHARAPRLTHASSSAWQLAAGQKGGPSSQICHTLAVERESIACELAREVHGDRAKWCPRPPKQSVGTVSLCVINLCNTLYTIHTCPRFGRETSSTLLALDGVACPPHSRLHEEQKEQYHPCPRHLPM
jgi:hypothetical protein